MKSILVIEDSRALREMLRDVLESKGYSVREAPHGQAGIDLYLAEPADLVITDIAMPGKDGLETIRDLKKEDPDVRIVAISGGDTGVPDRLQVAIGLGAICTIRKPFTPGDLLDVVRRLLA